MTDPCDPELALGRPLQGPSCSHAFDRNIPFRALPGNARASRGAVQVRQQPGTHLFIIADQLEFGEPVVANKWNGLGGRRFRDRPLLDLSGMALGDFPVPELPLGS